MAFHRNSFREMTCRRTPKPSKPLRAFDSLWLLIRVNLCNPWLLSLRPNQNLPAAAGPIRVIHRLRQPARSKELGNSFAGGQEAVLHRCLHRERTATSTPSRLTFAVNKICVNPCNLWLNKFSIKPVSVSQCQTVRVL
jgi:hypothetical protein